MPFRLIFKHFFGTPTHVRSIFPPLFFLFFIKLSSRVIVFVHSRAKDRREIKSICDNSSILIKRYDCTYIYIYIPQWNETCIETQVNWYTHTSIFHGVSLFYSQFTMSLPSSSIR